MRFDVRMIPNRTADCCEPGGAYCPGQMFLPRDTAIMVPHTRDGRVMFAIPWKGHVVVGTTDTPISKDQSRTAAARRRD